MRFIIIIYSFVFLSLNAFFQDQASVSFNAPSEIDAGEEYEVEITLDISEIDGFARFQQQLPAGIQARGSSSGNAQFLFEDQKVKYIWLKLPDQDQITLTYFLKSDKRLKGDFLVDGTFSFIANNERVNVNVDQKSIHINPNPNVAQSIDIDDYNKTFVTPSGEMAVDQLAAIRQAPAQLDDENEYQVNILVYKKDKEKFAKIEETIPEGFRAVSEESKPIFTFQDQQAKFIWLNLPKEPVFVVSYRLVPQAGMGQEPEDINIDGLFSYVEDSHTQIVKIIQKGDIDLSNQDMSYLKNIVNESSEEIASAYIEEKPNYEVGEAEQTYVTSQGGDLSPILKPIEGVYYRVQVAAGHEPVNTEEYFQQYNLKHKVETEKHEGWIKYSIGSFQTYKVARDYRVYVWNTTVIDDAFVAAYNDGKRITVQEALMITNQKWYR